MKTRKNNSTSPQFFLCVFTVRANPIPPPVSPLTRSRECKKKGKKRTHTKGARPPPRTAPPALSKLQAALPGRVRQGLDPAVVDVAAPVKGDLFDLGGLAQLRDLLAHQLRRFL